MVVLVKDSFPFPLGVVAIYCLGFSNHVDLSASKGSLVFKPEFAFAE
jgi:hypothetical protein